MCMYIGIKGKKISPVAPYIVGDRFHGIDQERLVDPEIDLLSQFLAREYARLPQHPQMVRDGRAAQRRYPDDLADVQALTALEGEQYPLPVLVAQRGVHLGNVAPFPGNRAHVVPVHDYKCSYIAMMPSTTIFRRSGCPASASF